jgi:hypothetical protein
MKTTDISEECQLALKVAAAALKVHGAVHGNFDLCKFVMKNYLTYEGMKRYIASMERLWKAVDITIDNPEEGLRLKREIEFYRFLEGRKDNIYTLPSVSSFPRWEVKINKDKPSKMYLCQMSPPHPITVTEFRKQFANYLDSLELPDIIELPLEEELLQPSDSAHASRGEMRKDKENETDLFGPFLYQSFMTGQDTPREVWLPPVEYKRSNLWWHIVLSPILKKIPDCCLGKSEEELLETMQRRFEPCRSIDLKGFGLQFPHEYIFEMLEELTLRYPNFSEEAERAKNLISNIEVYDDTSVIKPKRGTGLGYFTALRYLGVRSIYQGLKLITSFDDDVLIKESHFDEGVQRLQYYDLVVNIEKTGKRWKNVVWFINQAIEPGNKNMFSMLQHNSHISGIFNMRFHWERKLMVSSFEEDEQLIVAFHLEKIFGREFYRSEALSNTKDGGYMSVIPPKGGTQRGRYACEGVKPKIQPGWQTAQADFYQELTLDERRKVHQDRKARWKTRKVVDVYAYELLHPDIELNEDLLTDEVYKYPSWAEDAILEQGLTSGRTTRELSKSEIVNALIDYANYRDPIEAYASGGWKEREMIPTSVPDEVKDKILLARSCEITFCNRSRF